MTPAYHHTHEVRPSHTRVPTTIHTCPYHHTHVSLPSYTRAPTIKQTCPYHPTHVSLPSYPRVPFITPHLARHRTTEPHTRAQHPTTPTNLRGRPHAVFNGRRNGRGNGRKLANGRHVTADNVLGETEHDDALAHVLVLEMCRREDFHVCRQLQPVLDSVCLCVCCVSVLGQTVGESTQYVHRHPTLSPTQSTCTGLACAADSVALCSVTVSRWLPCQR
eukprot:3396915-Rhodomonas_salina.4